MIILPKTMRRKLVEEDVKCHKCGYTLGDALVTAVGVRRKWTDHGQVIFVTVVCPYCMEDRHHEFTDMTLKEFAKAVMVDSAERTTNLTEADLMKKETTDDDHTEDPEELESPLGPVPGTVVTGGDIEKVLQNIKTDRQHLPIEVPTGFSELDHITGGLRRGQLIVIAGHEDVGLTDFAVNIVQNACFGKSIPIAFFSMVLTRDHLIEKIMCSCARVDLRKVWECKLNDEEFSRIQKAGRLCMNAPLYLDDTPRLTCGEIHMGIDCMNAEHGERVRCIIIDCLQKMEPEYPQGIRRQRIARVSQDLKFLAASLSIPVVVLCNLGPAPLGSSASRPSMNDLGEDAIVERNADVFMLLSRDGYHWDLADKHKSGDYARISVVRNAQGLRGDVRVKYIEECRRFENPDYVEPDQPSA